MTVLGWRAPEPYHWGVAGTEEGDTQLDAVRPGYRQIADLLRERILSGEYPPGAPIPGQQALAAQLGADVAVVNRAVGVLGQEGLLLLAGHGRPTTVLEQRPWHVAVTIPWTGSGPPVPTGVVDAAKSLLAASAETDPGVPDLSVSVEWSRPSGDPNAPASVGLLVEATALAADWPIAAGRVWSLVRQSLRADEGWGLDDPQASVRRA
jgi:hypothetical protein